MKKEIDLKAISVLILSCLVGAVMLFMVLSMLRFGEGTTDKQAEGIMEVIRKAAVQCYALEGEYPPTLEYLCDNYGVILDESKYYYFYSAAFSSNMMPDVVVLPKNVTGAPIK